jgi:2-methylcitrate dehydratase PrpD
VSTTEQLARLAVETSYESLPAAALESAKLRFLDTIGIMLAGSRQSSALISLDLVRYLGGNPVATIAGHPDRTSSPLAAYVNGVSANALEYDDSTKGATHMSASLVPGSLAVAEELDRSGRQLLEGFVLAFEVEARIARGLMPQLFDRGWHPNGMLGTLGVAVAAARMMELDLEQTRMAIGIAASQASGVRKNVGSMAKPFHIGHSARCGVFAALLAQRGFKADPEIIEGSDAGEGHARFGFADTINGLGNYDLNRMVRALGTEWELAKNTTMVRLHPGATGASAAIDGMIDLAKAHDLRAEQVERVELETTPQTMIVASYPEATDSYTARFSLPYHMAVSLIDRKAGIAQYTDERVRRPDVQALMKRVVAWVPDDFQHHRGQWGEGGVNWGEMRLAVHLKDGRVFRAARSKARGWPEDPAGWDDLEEKYGECADGVLPPSRIDESLDMVRRLDLLPGVRELMAVLSAS